MKATINLLTDEVFRRSIGDNVSLMESLSADEILSDSEDPSTFAALLLCLEAITTVDRSDSTNERQHMFTRQYYSFVIDPD